MSILEKELFEAIFRMSDDQPKTRPAAERLKERFGELVEDLLDMLGEAFAPPPRLVPIPVREQPYPPYPPDPYR